MLELRTVRRAGGGGKLLDGASLQASAGEPLTILGYGAAGRRELARLLTGVDRPEAGSILLGGQDMAKARRARGGRDIASVAPPAGRPGAKTIAQRLASAGARDGRSGDLARLAGLTMNNATQARDLDAAGQARLALACALAGAPKLLVADAPASVLPVAQRADFLADAANLIAGAGAGAVVVWLAEEGGEAVALGGRTVVVHRGQIEQDGPSAGVAAHPATLAAARAVAAPALNTLDLDMDGATARLADGSTWAAPACLGLPATGAATLAFRPDDLRPDRLSETAARFVVRIDAAVDSGHVRVNFAGASWLMRAPETRRGAGLLVNAYVDQAHLMAFGPDGAALPAGPGG